MKCIIAYGKPKRERVGSNMRIHHFGFLVNNIESAVDKFMLLGYDIERGKKYISERKQWTLFMRHKENGERIELIQVEDKDSTAAGILKRNGVGVYHVCYETNNFEDEKIKLRKSGFLPVTREEIGLADQRIQFFYQQEIGLIELAEKEEEVANGRV